ncbi:hypothetical protein [Novosphingobium huizhouense]|uniref:hypothetical protein n=1 Tax=Novosphingobium huizhouense TaxID=2866625 RepID=UPI001CD8C219|nr:hypothetical protein [Novosphingobium huizhouense]
MNVEAPAAAPSRYGASKRDRPRAIVLAAAVCFALAAIVVRMGDYVEFGGEGRGELTAVSLSQERGEEKSRERKPEQKRKAAAQKQPVQPQPEPVARAVRIPPRVIVPAESPALPPGFIVMSRKDFAAADIGRMAPAAPAAASAGAGQAGGGASSPSVGEGPGGAVLYAAQWYREPRDAELGPYLPAARPPGSWAMIACRTIENYHVEDCRELAESPPGSGLARALRQAAWQFLVRPPRVDGKPQLGTWVRIRFDFRAPPPAEAR